MPRTSCFYHFNQIDLIRLLLFAGNTEGFKFCLVYVGLRKAACAAITLASGIYFLSFDITRFLVIMTKPYEISVTFNYPNT